MRFPCLRMIFWIFYILEFLRVSTMFTRDKDVLTEMFKHLVLSIKDLRFVSYYSY